MEEVIRQMVPPFIAFLAYHIYALNRRIGAKDEIIEALRDHLGMVKSNLEHDAKDRKWLQEMETKQLKSELEKYAAALNLSEEKIQRIREIL